MGVRYAAIAVFCMICLTRMPAADSAATINLQLISFTNIDQRKFDLSCCNVPCSTLCTYLYEVCFGDPNPNLQYCTVPSNQTFDSVQLPQIQYLTSSTASQMPVKILVWTVSQGSVQLVDYTNFQISINPATQTLNLTGTRLFSLTSFSVSATVSCNPHYYGIGCGVYCLATDSFSSGHYTCNSAGNQVCLQGWGGAGCAVAQSKCPIYNPPPAPLMCQAIDLVFILDSSGSVNNISPNNWNLEQTFVQAVIKRVTLGPSSLQIGVVTFSSSATLSIPLSAYSNPSLLSNAVQALPYLGGGTNLRAGLSTARLQAFAPSNGARPGAYRAVVLVYDGEPPTAAYGTLVDEAPMLQNMGVDVYVVSLSYYFTSGLANLNLVQSISSQPFGDHLYTNLANWATLSNTAAPSILANLQDTCMRQGAATIAAGQNTTPGIGGTNSATPGLTSGGPPSSALPTGTTLGATQGAGSFPTTSSGSGSTSPIVPPPVLDPYCSSQGTCSGSAANITCYCAPGYAGSNCQYQDNPCSYDPCNGGQCTMISNTNYVCTCLLGFSGSNCQIAGAPITCSNNPCSGGGTGSCLTTTPSPQCAAIPTPPCAQYYYGTNCQTLCIPTDSCVGHYTCDTNGNKVCRQGWTNTTSGCTVPNGYVSSCSSTCQNGAICFNQGCCCPPGFTGFACNIAASTATPGPGSSTSPTPGPNFSTSPTPGPNFSTSPTPGPNFSTSPTPGPNFSTSNTPGPNFSTSNTPGPNQSSSSSGSTQSSVTGLTTSPIGSTASQSSTVFTTTQMTNATTLSPIQNLLSILYAAIAATDSSLSPVQIEALINSILLTLSSAIPSASFADLSSSTDPPPPVYLSTPWPGTGQLTGYSVQFEVLKAVLTQFNGEYQLTLTADYVLTAPNGTISRLSTQMYNQMSANNAVNVVTNFSNLHLYNQLVLTVYGSYMDTQSLNKFTAAFFNTYSVVNPGWSTKSNARIVVGDVNEMIGLGGETMTSFQFWLVSGSGSNTTEEVASSIVQPTDTNIATELSAHQFIPNVVVHHGVSFNMANSFGIFVVGTVYRSDMAQFQNVITQYWSQSVQLQTYSGLEISLVGQDKFFLPDGTPVTRLVYFVYNTTFTLNPNNIEQDAIPTRETFTPLVQQIASLNKYQLLSSSQSRPIAIFRQKVAFSVVSLERVPSATFTLMQSILQNSVQQVAGYSNAQVVVVTSDEYYAIENRVTFSQTLWYVIVNGSVVDSRVGSNGQLGLMWQLAPLLYSIQLPNGSPLTYVTEDMSIYTKVSRQSCFSLFVAAAQVNADVFQLALSQALLATTPTWTQNRVGLSVAYLDEYITTNGSSVTAVMYAVYEINSEMADNYVDASIFTNAIISLSSLSQQLAALSSSSSSSSSSPYVLMDNSIFSATNPLRYINIFSLFISEMPSQQDVGLFIRKLQSLYQQQISTTASVQLAGVEEYFTASGLSVWRLGYFLFINGTVAVWPESIPPITTDKILSSVQIFNGLSGSFYTVIANATTSSYARAKDMFIVIVNYRLSASSYATFASGLGMAFKQSFADYQLSAVTTCLVSSQELFLPTQETSLFRYYYAIQADGWAISALKQSSTPISSIMDQLSAVGLTSAQGQQIVVIQGSLSITLGAAVFGEATTLGFSYRADFAYSLPLVGLVDTDVASAAVATSSLCWSQLLGPSSVNVTLRGIKAAYGSFGVPVTMVLYSVQINGAYVQPVIVTGPPVACISSTVSQSALSVSVYSSANAINLCPSSSITSVVRQDDLFSVVVNAALDKSTLTVVRQSLSSAWTNSLGVAVAVTIIATESRITAVNNSSPVTVVYYSSCFVNGTVVKTLTLTDTMMPAVSLVGMTTASASLPLSSLEVVSTGRLSVSDINKATQAVQLSIAPSQQGASVSVNFLGTSQLLYSRTSDWTLVTKISYAITLNNQYVFNAVSSNILTTSLAAQALTPCTSRASRTFRIFTLSSATQVQQMSSSLTTAILNSWTSTNKDVNSILFSVQINTATSRSKRATTSGISTPVYQNTNGAPAFPVDYRVTVGGYDPTVAFVQYPSQLSLSQSVSTAGLTPICSLDSSSTSCTLLQCNVLYVLGQLSTSSLTSVQGAISNAYVSANAVPATINIVAIATAVNESGIVVSSVNYCANVSIDNTGLDPFAIPSFSSMSNALSTVGLTVVSVDPSTLTPTQSTNNTTTIIIACVVVGGILLIVVVGLVAWRVVAYYRKRQLKDDDKQKLSVVDTDSFVGRGLAYNGTSSPFNTIKQTPGSMSSKIFFIDSASADP